MVRLELKGENLAVPAEQTWTTLKEHYASPYQSFSMRNFDPVRGRGHIEIRDGSTLIVGESCLPAHGKIGPSRVSVVYKEETDDSSYRAHVDKYFRDFRDALVRQQSI